VPILSLASLEEAGRTQDGLHPVYSETFIAAVRVVMRAMRPVYKELIIMVHFFMKRPQDGPGQALAGQPVLWALPRDAQFQTLAYRLFESSGTTLGQAITTWLAADKQLCRDSVRTFWIAQERARRRSMFPRACRREEEASRSSDRWPEDA
jgi:hypothetical protein